VSRGTGREKAAPPTSAPHRDGDRDAQRVPVVPPGLGNEALSSILAPGAVDVASGGDIARLPAEVRNAVTAQFGSLLGAALHDVRLAGR
jgi:hypothetical protein